MGPRAKSHSTKVENFTTSERAAISDLDGRQLRLDGRGAKDRARRKDRSALRLGQRFCRSPTKREGPANKAKSSLERLVAGAGFEPTTSGL